MTLLHGTTYTDIPVPYLCAYAPVDGSNVRCDKPSGPPPRRSNWNRTHSSGGVPTRVTVWGLLVGNFKNGRERDNDTLLWPLNPDPS